MKKIAAILFLFIFLSQKECFSQFYEQLDSLCMMCEKSTSDFQKVNSLGKLADFYYVFKLNSKGDSVLHEQLLVAEFSNDSNLIIQTLFGQAILNIGPSSTVESFNKTIQFIQKGIDFAKANKKYDYLVLGYVRMSEVLRKRGEYDQAFSNSVLAISLLANVTSDSVKSIAYIEFGDAYLNKGKAIKACESYNTAFDFAVKIKSVTLQSEIYHCLSEMYKQLKDSTLAREELNNSVILNKKKGNKQGLLMDYYDLARLTDEKFFIVQCIKLADSLHDYKNLLNAKRLMLVYYYVVEKQDRQALWYLESEPDLKKSFLNDGRENYFITLGNIYFYSGKIDSALNYYLKAQPDLDKKFDLNTSRINLEQIAECYHLKNKFPEAVSYYRKALRISLQMNEFNTIAQYSGKLSTLFEKQNDYKNAFFYSKQFMIYKDSLRDLSKENDIALLGVERENNKHANELLEQQQRDYNNRNIQYMGITIAIIIIFFMMLFVGSFPVSKFTVRIMGFVFFISLFEFIVLLIDNLVLSHAFYNEPLKMWVIKIGVISLLAPFQHFLEQHVIELLSSKKLLEARTKFSLKKWWSGIKQPASYPDENVVEDPTVL